MSQIVYTELEGFPLRWPYLALEPLDKETTKTWTSDQNFNTATSSTTYTPNDTGGTLTELAIYGSRKLGQIIKKNSTAAVELWSGFEASIRKVGNPGDLQVEIYSITRSSTVFLEDSFYIATSGGSASSQDSVSKTTWRGCTINYPNRIILRAIQGVPATAYNSPQRGQVRAANTDGSPSSTVLADGAADADQIVWFDPPLDLSPGLYSLIAYNSSGTSYILYNVGWPSDFPDAGTPHSTWVSTNSGSTWSNAGRSSYAFWQIFRSLAYVPDSKLGEISVPASQIGTTTSWTSLYPDVKRIIQDEIYYVVLSSPSSPDINNCYILQRGGSYSASTWHHPTRNLVEDHSAFYDGSTWVYKPHDLLIRKTYTEHSVADTYTNTYYLGPGSYSPKTSIRIKASSGTVYAMPVISSGVFVKPFPEKSTTSTNYTTLVWDVAGGVPEIISPSSNPIRFLVRGSGAYNQTSYEPRIYYDKNPVAPRDFGFTELYLMRLRAEVADTLARINDKTNTYFANAGDTLVVDPSFRAPINKIHVVKGKITADLLGVV
ncbi:MAG: hypothetical protein QXY50_00805 [Candidatus Caldarchaeum sp.]